MKNIKKSLFVFTGLLVCLAFGLAGCIKDAEMVVPPQKAAFVQNPASGSYQITTPTTTFAIPIGLTAVSSSPTTVKITVSSTTGAQLGTHFTVNNSTLTIPAGKVLDSIVVQGIYNQYTAGRKDTLIFKIEDVSTSPSLRNTYTLAIQGPCNEGSVNLNSLLGDYTNTMEDFGGAYGPYTTRVTAVNATSATTGTITVANVFDAGWNPITFTLNWTDPNNRTVTLVQQAGIGNAGTVNSNYDGLDISVRPFTGQVGTFSVCNQTITLKMQVGVTGLGWFGTLYTVNMAR